jgi:hypothetical protein
MSVSGIQVFILMLLLSCRFALALAFDYWFSSLAYRAIHPTKVDWRYCVEEDSAVPDSTAFQI